MVNIIQRNKQADGWLRKQFKLVETRDGAVTDEQIAGIIVLFHNIVTYRRMPCTISDLRRIAVSNPKRSLNLDRKAKKWLSQKGKARAVLRDSTLSTDAQIILDLFLKEESFLERKCSLADVMSILRMDRTPAEQTRAREHALTEKDRQATATAQAETDRRIRIEALTTEVTQFLEVVSKSMPHLI